MTVIETLPAKPKRIRKPSAGRPVPAVAPGVALAVATTPMDLLRLAMEKGASVEQLSELVKLQQTMQAHDARAAFFAAVAQFQAKCPPIRKNSNAKIVTRSGTDYTYTYAELDDIARTVNPILAELGLSYSWDAVVNGALTVTCTLRHVAGHSEQSSCQLPVENASAMSPQQKVGAAMTFAQRRSLSSVLGLTTTDSDTDGSEKGGETLTPQQVEQVEALLAAKSVGRDASKVRARILAYAKADDVPDILADDLAKVLGALGQLETRAAV